MKSNHIFKLSTSAAQHIPTFVFWGQEVSFLSSWKKTKRDIFLGRFLDNKQNIVKE